MKNQKKHSIIMTITSLVFCFIVSCVTVKAATPDDISIPVSIKLTGTLPEKAEEFTVKMQADDQAYPMPEEIENGIYSMTVTADSAKTLPKIIFNKVGVYTYKVWQEAGSDTKCTYDDSTYSVKITITNNLTYEGYEATVAIRKNTETTKVDEIVFENEYEVVEPKTGDDSNSIFWIILAFISLTTILSIKYIKRRTN